MSSKGRNGGLVPYARSSAKASREEPTQLPPGVVCGSRALGHLVGAHLRIQLLDQRLDPALNLIANIPQAGLAQAIGVDDIPVAELVRVRLG